MKQPGAVFHSLFSLLDGVSQEEFLPALTAFYDHLVDTGLACGYRILRRCPLEGFGQTLPDFEFHAELEFPGLNEDRACYEYVKRNEEPVRSLHRAVNSRVRAGSADFFLGVLIAGHANDHRRAGI